MSSTRVSLVLNGEQRTFEVPAGRRLLDLLRDDAGLTGTKEGCGAGECGACTVLLNDLPVPSCLVLAASCEGGEVVTIEGLGRDRSLHPLQRTMVEHGGVQCGFCTPGVVITGAALLEHGVTDPLEQGRRLAGNLCRCTGYTKIFEALKAAPREPGDG
jgi:aerobic-type carbon monoxide dehydrogenase small subunit (CoxS/CutS family)